VYLDFSRKVLKIKSLEGKKEKEEGLK